MFLLIVNARMTRVNVLPPQQLTDQHLQAELREIPRIGTLVMKAHTKGKCLPVQPTDFVLGEGHVIFFYDKLGYILQRIKLLQAECVARAINVSIIDYEAEWRDLPLMYWGSYTPTERAIVLSKSRVLARIMDKPDWYRYHKNKLPSNFMSSYRLPCKR